MKILDSLVIYPSKNQRTIRKFTFFQQLILQILRIHSLCIRKMLQTLQLTRIPHFHVFDQIRNTHPSKSRRCSNINIFIEALTEQKKSRRYNRSRTIIFEWQRFWKSEWQNGVSVKPKKKKNWSDSWHWQDGRRRVVKKRFYSDWTNPNNSIFQFEKMSSLNQFLLVDVILMYL